MSRIRSKSLGLIRLSLPLLAGLMLTELIQAGQELQAADRMIRPAVVRREYDPQTLKQLGIHTLESQHLRLITDVDPGEVKHLPQLVDQIYEAWTVRFGELPPASDKSPLQITGYLMKDLDRFRSAGMIRDDLPAFDHGRHLGLEFWMKEQDIPYYREHLLLHEATHCYMTAMPGGDLPLWYHEGMAELMGVHKVGASGRTSFGLFPDNEQDYKGFGRIRVLKSELAAGRQLTVAQVSSLGIDEFTSVTGQPYAWSWALCSFLDQHPVWQKPFRELGRHLFESGFQKRWDDTFANNPQLEAEWQLFLHHIQPGYDFTRATIPFQRGSTFARETEVVIRADLGWQSTGLILQPGQEYIISAIGRSTLGQSSRPWISEPDGISLRYAGGQPIGTLMGAVVSDLRHINGAGGLLKPMVIGRSTLITPTAPGTLYLRINDDWNSLDNNAGHYTITVTPRP